MPTKTTTKTAARKPATARKPVKAAVPAKAAPEPKPSGPSWGREVDGLQAGLEISGGFRRRIGEAV